MRVLAAIDVLALGCSTTQNGRCDLPAGYAHVPVASCAALPSGNPGGGTPADASCGNDALHAYACGNAGPSPEGCFVEPSTSIVCRP